MPQGVKKMRRRPLPYFVPPWPDGLPRRENMLQDLDPIRMVRAITEVQKAAVRGQLLHVFGVGMVYVGKGDDLGNDPLPATCIRDALAPEDRLGGFNLQDQREALAAKVERGEPGALEELKNLTCTWETSLQRHRAWWENWHANRRILRRGRNEGTVHRAARRGKPLFIVGNGPSLAKNQEHLNSIDPEKAIVIFTNRVPKGAETAGRYYGCVDYLARGRDGKSFLDGVETKEMTALIDVLVPQHISRRAWKTRLWSRFSVLDNPLSDQIRREFSWICPTASWILSVYTFLWLGLVWECDPIVFVGQDLSFGENDELHMGEKLADGEYPTLIDINGVEVATTSNMQRAALCVQAQMELHQKLAELVPGRPCPRFVNATEGGILKHGCEQMTLEKAINTWGLKCQREPAVTTSA